MPIEFKVDAQRRLVTVRIHGTLTDDEIFGYQRETWARPEIAGFDELVDMNDVEHIAVPSATRVRDLAELSAGMDVPTMPSKLAIVAATSLAYGLARMYETYRSLDRRSVKQVSVFRSTRDALKWLGFEGDPGGLRRPEKPG